MRADLVAYLRCPVCRQRLSAAGRCLRCPAGHSFDLARQGYVDLTGGPVRHGGDTAEMVAARLRLLAGGLFEPLRAAVAEAAADAGGPGGLVVDAGAGTGYYLAAALDARPHDLGLAVDVSKPALRRAAAAHPRAGAVRADIWRGLPVADRVAGLVLDVFAPRSGPEFRRILHPDGRLVVVTPTPDHLNELVEIGGLLGVDPAKRRRLVDGLGGDLDLAAERVLRWPVPACPEQARELVAMGPSAWHDGPARLTAALAGRAAPVMVTASVRLTVWRPKR